MTAAPDPGALQRIVDLERILDRIHHAYIDAQLDFDDLIAVTVQTVPVDDIVTALGYPWSPEWVAGCVTRSKNRARQAKRWANKTAR